MEHTSSVLLDVLVHTKDAARSHPTGLIDLLQNSFCGRRKPHSLASLVSARIPLTKAVKRRREDYWYLPDLDDFKRGSQQRLEPNNPDSTYVFPFRVHDTLYQKKFLQRNWFSCHRRG